MSVAESYVFCNSCQQCVRADTTRQVEVFPQYAEELDPRDIYQMLPATVCTNCFRDFYSPVLQSRANGEHL